MFRRLWAFTVALVIAGAPVAAVLCQVTCESHDAEAMAPAVTMTMPMAGHAHHHSSVPPAPISGVTMTAVPRACDYPADAAIGVLQQTLQMLTAPALVSADVFSLAGLLDRPLPVHAHTAHHSPPGALALPAQLRV